LEKKEATREKQNTRRNGARDDYGFVAHPPFGRGKAFFGFGVEFSHNVG